jgi:hypothetical protein
MHLAIGAASIPGDTASNMEAAAKMDPRVSKSLKQGISDLAEMAPCHHFAEQALNILRYLVKKWNIDVDVDNGKSPPEDFDKLVKPYTSSLNFFAPNVQGGDYQCDWGPTKSKASKTDLDTKETGDHMENPLFWPFPMQGKPLIPSGEELEQAGFELIHPN